MKDLLIQRGYKITDGQEQPYFLALKAFEPNQTALFLPYLRTIPQVELIEGKVVVDMFWHVACSHCGHGLSQLEVVRQACKAAAEEVGDVVTLREQQIERADRVRYGTGDKHIVLINGERWKPGGGFSRHDNHEPFIQRIIELAKETSSGHQN